MTTPPTILLIGHDAALSYLLARFAAHSGYGCQVQAAPMPINELQVLRPAVVIFLSPDLLAQSQDWAAALAGFETPILVCSATEEEAQSRGLGADYCLLHPLTYSDFQTALAAVAAPLTTRNINPAE